MNVLGGQIYTYSVCGFIELSTSSNTTSIKPKRFGGSRCKSRAAAEVAVAGVLTRGPSVANIVLLSITRLLVLFLSGSNSYCCFHCHRLLNLCYSEVVTSGLYASQSCSEPTGKSIHWPTVCSSWFGTECNAFL